MKIILLLCVCASAYAQFERRPTNRGSSQYQSGQYQNNQFQSNQYQNNQVQNTQYQNKNQYQASQFQTRGQIVDNRPTESSGICREKNERHPVPGSCDSYIECLNGTAEEKLCPDGLRYNPYVNFNVYPCQYPNEVPCLERSALQPAQPTEQCPHQFGYFRMGDAKNCSTFRSCVNGVGFDITCPEGLAYSSQTYRCEWPDEVEDCDVEAFLGFRCPEIPTSRELGPPTGFRFYRSQEDCQKYFLCNEGKPRLLHCGGSSAFDELTLRCVLADEVDACPAELKNLARISREEEQERLARELELKSQSPKLKKTY